MIKKLDVFKNINLQILYISSNFATHSNLLIVFKNLGKSRWTGHETKFEIPLILKFMQFCFSFFSLSARNTTKDYICQAKTEKKARRRRGVYTTMMVSLFYVLITSLLCSSRNYFVQENISEFTLALKP